VLGAGRELLALVPLTRRACHAGGLLVAGGWLSLLAATCLTDLRRWAGAGAAAYLRTAAQLAGGAGHDELAAWCLETQSWQALTSGDFKRATDLARAARRLAPHGSSAHIQATAQQGRALVRWPRTFTASAATRR
jgi:hypothetical protein